MGHVRRVRTDGRCATASWWPAQPAVQLSAAGDVRHVVAKEVQCIDGGRLVVLLDVEHVAGAL